MQEARYQNEQGLWSLHEQVMAREVARLTHQFSRSPLPSTPNPSLGASSDDETLEGSGRETAPIPEDQDTAQEDRAEIH